MVEVTVNIQLNLSYMECGVELLKWNDDKVTQIVLLGLCRCEKECDGDFKILCQ